MDLFAGQPGGADQAASLATLIEIVVERGALAAAERAMSDHGRREQIPDGMTFNLLLEARGALRLAQARWAEALDDLLAYGRREHDWYGANAAFSSYRSRTAGALTALGEIEQARLLAEEELERGVPSALAGR